MEVWIFVAALTVAAFTPGPGLAAIVAATLAQGAGKTLWFCIGVILGDLVWLSLSLSGLALIAQQIPAVFVLVKWAGILYLLWLALKIWRSDPAIEASTSKTSYRSPLSRILAGFAVTMGNPKAMLFYIALLPSLVDANGTTFADVLPLYLAVIVVLTTVFLVYVSAANAMRRTLKNSRTVKAFNKFTATALGGAAAWIASR